MASLHSYDEWSTLREVIVGSAENYTSHDRELSFDVFFHENLYRSDWAYPRLAASTPVQDRSWQIKQRYVDELNEDVENLAKVLTSLGVTVHRPLPLLPDTPSIKGLGWEAMPVPALNVRDNTLILGDEIIETPPAMRSRYLETRLIAPVFKAYYDAGARWTTMPRPILTDRSFDLSYARDTETTLGGPTEPISDPQPSTFDVGYEMMLDGAQCLRLGRDLVVNIANENHALAVNWLERHLGDRYRVHRAYRMSDNHIDSMILALRPGVFLARHAGIRDHLPATFRNWDFIIPDEPTSFPTYDDDDLVLTSPYIDLNVLSVSPNMLLCNKACVDLIRKLERSGFDVVPVQHRHRRLFGGGFHCFTLDTVRDGELEDYSR
ncbi:glycine amidinotransferase [Rhizobium leguminosarum]|uniref:glycine amidinotransferase n=1 Tax=Rhizobium ruizarguesonis TaxID=2081791 RepID=UPI00102F8E4D|nr:glycine amidinotransferase [Rhizobium ruizarguesonis]NEI14607.1 glycine amidinotransferase [Rhizobium ruizarguesonis]TAW76189.1 glycine amidinotransferase [Rhizobium ruizarguesonis]TAX13144.1 glycine amidinotransferase [Rhizobium ruizarguesonis]TAX17975.1 glycine amidinotransferase [Rhizobium ruizarguesonis]